MSENESTDSARPVKGKSSAVMERDPPRWATRPRIEPGSVITRQDAAASMNVSDEEMTRLEGLGLPFHAAGEKGGGQHVYWSDFLIVIVKHQMQFPNVMCPRELFFPEEKKGRSK